VVRQLAALPAVPKLRHPSPARRPCHRPHRAGQLGVSAPVPDHPRPPRLVLKQRQVSTPRLRAVARAAVGSATYRNGASTASGRRQRRLAYPPLLAGDSPPSRPTRGAALLRHRLDARLVSTVVEHELVVTGPWVLLT
jgi:hypothetical protein